MNLPTLIIIGLGVFMLVSMFKDNVDMGGLFSKPQGMVNDVKTKIDETASNLKGGIEVPKWMLIAGGILLIMLMRK